MEDFNEIILTEGGDFSSDAFEESALESLRKYFKVKKNDVFFGRQIEVLFEKQFFHWITNRVLRRMVEYGELISEKHKLSWGGNITLYWHPSFRYYKREAKKIIKIVESYSVNSVGAALGSHGEFLVLEGFAKLKYLFEGRSINEYGDRKWNITDHDLDMILVKDKIAYGVEVKNTLGYMDKKEFDLKIELCHHLGIRPVFVARMLPASWINELRKEGGFSLILQYQLFPPYFDGIVKQMKESLGLPVDCPKSLWDGTMQRFENWHQKNVNL